MMEIDFINKTIKGCCRKKELADDFKKLKEMVDSNGTV
jgi:hypothetical protein